MSTTPLTNQQTQFVEAVINHRPRTNDERKQTEKLRNSSLICVCFLVVGSSYQNHQNNRKAIEILVPHTRKRYYKANIKMSKGSRYFPLQTNEQQIYHFMQKQVRREKKKISKQRMKNQIGNHIRQMQTSRNMNNRKTNRNTKLQMRTETKHNN